MIYWLRWALGIPHRGLWPHHRLERTPNFWGDDRDAGDWGVTGVVTGLSTVTENYIYNEKYSIPRVAPWRSSAPCKPFREGLAFVLPVTNGWQVRSKSGAQVKIEKLEVPEWLFRPEKIRFPVHHPHFSSRHFCWMFFGDSKQRISLAWHVLIHRICQEVCRVYLGGKPDQVWHCWHGLGIHGSTTCVRTWVPEKGDGLLSGNLT